MSMPGPTRGSRQALLRLRLPLPLLGLFLWGFPACGGDVPGEDPDARGVLVLEGGTVYTSSMTDPIDDGVIVVLDGVIEAVGPRGTIRIPPAARRVAVSGLTIVPGFWNVDVRIPEELLDLAATGSDEALTHALEERFTRYGFTTLVETSRGATELAPLRERLATGRVRGPRILPLGPGLPTGLERTAGGSGPGGPEVVEGPSGVGSAARGADRAAREVALVPALTRTSYPGEGESPEEANRRLMDTLDELQSFVLLGGTLVFGSGAGYVPEYDPSADYLLLEDADVPTWAILEALTLAPALRLGHDYTGLLEAGMVADLVVLDGDPIADPIAFGRVRWVLKEGVTQFNVLGN